MRRALQLAVAYAVAVACTASAQASLLAAAPNCSPAAGKPDCGLGGFLHLLYVVAAILAVILVAVVVLAIYLYRKNEKTEINPR